MQRLMTSTLALAAFVMAGSAGAQDKVKLGYINKMGDHPWFVSEVQGAKDKAAELGAEILTQDVQFNADLTVTTMDTMIGDGTNGIAIVVPDKGLGPVVAQKAKDAGVALVAVDDDIYFEDGSPVPYVGLDAYSIGKSVGAELARIYEEEGWADKEVRIASIEDRKADTCMQRNKGAEEAFLAAVPDFKPENIIRVAYDNTMVNSIDVMTTTLTANPQVTNWIFYSCNDDGVLGAARAMENSGYPAEAGLGIGIDGSRACDAFGSGRVSAFRGTMWLNSAQHGAIAVQLLHDAVANGKPLPEKTFSEPELINSANFDQYKGKLCQG